MEHAVKIVKTILKRKKDPAKALLAHRSTPLACGFSPAELLMGRRLRTSIPTFHTNWTPKWPDMERLKAMEADIKAKQAENFNQLHLRHSLSPLEPDTSVFVRDKDTTGVVISPEGTPKSYLIDTPLELSGEIEPNLPQIQVPT